jgi:Protein of unknown function (DUF402)
MPQPDLEPIHVMRGDAGPFPGIRLGEAIAYEFSLDPSLTPRPGTTRLERVYVLLDLGVQLSNPPSWHGSDAACWYIDLVSVTHHDGQFQVWDLYADVIVATDGRPYRMLDLDELANAIHHGAVPLAVGLDGLGRWQQFLDRHLHTQRMPAAGWTDFPPAAIAPLRALPAPLAALHSNLTDTA